MISIKINENLLLRTYEHEDAQELFRCIDESRNHLRGFLNWIDGTTKVEHSEQFIEHAQLQIDNQKGIILGIFWDNKIIGSVGMHNWDQHLNKAHVGYWIAKEFEGRGLMLLSVVRFIDFLFARLELNKIEICYIPKNERSHALAARLGAKIEGVLRQNVKMNGHLEDLVIAGILRHEWSNRT